MRQVIVEPQQPFEVTNASAVVCQWTKRALRLHWGLTIDINGEVRDKDYLHPCIETRFHNLYEAS